MTSTYLTHDQMIARGDIAVAQAKKELAQEIISDKKRISLCKVHA